MANPEHIEALRQGTRVWNEWRSENLGSSYKWPGSRYADLTKADLTGLELSDGADLSHANLEGAILRESYIRRAVFHRAKMNGADLSNAGIVDSDFNNSNLQSANCTGANLWWGNFVHAILNYADLRSANLKVCNFYGAYMYGANLKDAGLGATIFANTYIEGAEGLDSCKHDGPSVIDHSTLAMSGMLPLTFMRGCGLPDVLIDYFPSLLNNPIQFYSCFISYSSIDQDFADRLYADLQNKGVRCWFAPEDLKIGDRFRDKIDESIRLHDKLLLILSENSVSSQWVGDEVEAAFERERRENRTVLFPIQIDGTVTESTTGWAAAIRRTRHVGDFTNWKSHDSYQKAFARLLRDLKAEA